MHFSIQQSDRYWKTPYFLQLIQIRPSTPTIFFIINLHHQKQGNPKGLQLPQSETSFRFFSLYVITISYTNIMFMLKKSIIELCILTLILASCPNSQKASTSWSFGPSTGHNCQTATDYIQSNFNAYSLRLACKARFDSITSLPDEVYGIQVTSCFIHTNGNVQTNVQICCFPLCQQAHVTNLHYPSSTATCPSVIAIEETNYNSYHYRKACKQEYGMSYIPNQVYDISVTSCLNVNTNPTPGWSSGVVFDATVCCFEQCPSNNVVQVGNLHYPNNNQQYTCPQVIQQQSTALTSYHYRKACENQGVIPSQVHSVTVIECVDIDQTPLPGWSGGLVLTKVRVCC